VHKSVDRIISLSDPESSPRASNVDLQTILFTSAVCRSQLGLDYTHGYRNPDVLVQFTGNLGRREIHREIFGIPKIQSR